MPHDRQAAWTGAPDWPRMPPLTTQVAIREDGQMTWCGELHFGITRGNLLVIHGIRPKSAKGLPKSLHASLPYLPLIGRFSGITDNRNPCMPPRHALLAARVVATWWAVWGGQFDLGSNPSLRRFPACHTCGKGLTPQFTLSWVHFGLHWCWFLNYIAIHIKRISLQNQNFAMTCTWLAWWHHVYWVKGST